MVDQDQFVSPFRGSASAGVSQALFNGDRRPYLARELSASQLKRGDVFMFFSPKENRKVTVLGPLQLAFRLQLEFDPQVVAVTERPRSIPVGLSDTELHFWWQRRGGRECFALIIPNAQTIPGVDGKRRPRQLDRLRAAATDAYVSLRLVTEDELKAPACRNELCLQLLGTCQSARGLGSALVLRQEVAETIQRGGRMRVEELFTELGHFPHTHLQAAVAELLHIGFLQTDANPRMTSRSILWRTEV